MRYSKRREWALSQDEESQLNWLDIGESYKACRNWALVAQAQCISVKDLEEAFNKWPDRPVRATSLKLWASMLEAEKDIERCKLQSLRADSGGRAEQKLLAELQVRAKDLLDYQPRCCAASTFFMQGATVQEAEKVMGPLKCSKVDECREKCQALAHTLVRQSILQAATEGSVRAMMYYGDTVLHLGAEGETVFSPTRLVFTPEAMKVIAEEEAKDDERRARQN